MLDGGTGFSFGTPPGGKGCPQKLQRTLADVETTRAKFSHKRRHRMAANSLAYWQEWEPLIARNIAVFTQHCADQARAGQHARAMLAELRSDTAAAQAHGTPE